MFGQQRYQGNILLALTVMLILVFPLQADSADESEGIPVLSGKLYPTLRQDTLYNDNVLLQDNRAKDSIVIVTAPRLKYSYEGNITEFTMNMGIENGYYTHSHNDNYFDADTDAKFSIYPTEKLAFFGSAGYRRFHEVRGSGSQSGLRATEFDSPDKYRLWLAEVGIRYGVEEVGSPRFEVSYLHNERRYSNNRRRTRIQDRNIDGINTTIFYQILPNTSLLVQGNLLRNAYKKGFAPGDLDSDQFTVLTGLSWQATFQTEGYFKVGWNEKYFDNSQRGESANLSWEVGVNWFPLSYSNISLVTQQRLQEADGLGNDANVRNVSLSWKHDWYRNIKTTTNLFYNNSDFSGNTREDNDFGAGISLDYEFRRWLTIGADYQYLIRSSTAQDFDYERNVFGIHVLLSL